MTKEEFLTNLQIVELARNQPKLKTVHDLLLQQCIDHAEEMTPKADTKVALRRIEPKAGDA